MIGLLASIRPDEQNFPLFVHVLGAMILVGGLLTTAGALAWARGDAGSLRLYRALLAVALPGWIVMRIGAQWISPRKAGTTSPTRLSRRGLGIGNLLADLGGLILLVSLIVGGIGVYRLREGKGSGLLKATLILSLILLAAYVVAVWAMAGKPD